MRPYLVFIDDDPKELTDLGSIVSDVYDYEPVTWPHKGAIHLNRVPDLFVLDMYFPKPDSPSAIGKKELDVQRLKASRIASDFAALYGDSIVAPDLLRRTFACIQEGYDLLWSQCAALGQTAEHGRELLAGIQADQRFTDVPIVFYSRKATVEDGVRALQAGAFAVIPKAPSPPSRSARESVLAQLEAARLRFADLSKSRRKERWPININITLYKQEVVAQKIEFTLAKIGA